MKALVDSARRSMHDRRQDVRLPCDRSAARVAGRKPGDDPRHGRAIFAKPGREVIYDAEHFFDGLKANPEYAAKTLLAAAEAGADRHRAVRHQRRHACRKRSPSSRGGRGAEERRHAGRHPHATTIASWPSPTRWPPSTPAPSKCKAPSTASANAAATPTCLRRSPIWRSRTGLRCARRPAAASI